LNRPARAGLVVFAGRAARVLLPASGRRAGTLTVDEPLVAIGFLAEDCCPGPTNLRDDGAGFVFAGSARFGIGGTVISRIISSSCDVGPPRVPMAEVGLESIGVSELKKLERLRLLAGVGGIFAIVSIVLSASDLRDRGVWGW
jgi:hypothetical protein